MFDFARYEIRRGVGTIIGWTLGLSAFVLIYIPVYTTLPQDMLQTDLGSIEVYRIVGISNMGTFYGYFTSIILNLLTLMLGIYGIIIGTGSLAGEDDSGVLELWVTLPLKRWQLVLAKALALVSITTIIILLVALVTLGSFTYVNSQVETGLSAGKVFLLTVSSWSVTLAFGMMGLLLSAFLPTRRSALVASILILLGSYFGNNLAPLVDSLERMQSLFLYHHYNTGITAIMAGELSGDTFILLLISVLLLIVGIFAFERRNITVHAWSWQRKRTLE